MPSRTVREYYDKLGEEEWKRLEPHPYPPLELLTHMRFLRMHLPRGGTALDAGGGPGRYAIFLAKRGFRVVLLDLSRVQLDIARRKATRARVPGRAIEYVEGALPDLSRFPDGRFDAVLCLGPLSHLIDPRERRRAAGELVRVAKEGAPLFISVINRYGVLRTVLQKRHLREELVDAAHREMIERGVHRAHPGRGPGRFTDAYFFTPHELRAMFENAGVEVLTMAACEGLAAHLHDPLSELAEDRRKWNAWMRIHWRTCTEPSVLGIAEHVLLVGRKRRGVRARRAVST